MAKNLNKRYAVPLLGQMLRMHRAAAFGADATSLTVSQLKSIIDTVHNSFNSAKSHYDGLVSDSGSAENARAILASMLEPSPADIGSTLIDIRGDVLALLNAYASSSYSASEPAWTYTVSLVGGSLDGGHVDAQVSAGVVSALNTLCASLRDSVSQLSDSD